MTWVYCTRVGSTNEQCRDTCLWCIRAVVEIRRVTVQCTLGKVHGK